MNQPLSALAQQRERPGFLVRVGAVLVLTLLGLMADAQNVAAATFLVVDDDGMALATDCNAAAPAYPTITAAVTAASPGDVIIVCPGLYNEQVQINKNNLHLRGAQVGVDARTRPFVPDPATQSIIEHPCGPVQLMADDIELNGFTVQGATLPDPCFLAGIWSNPGFSGTSGGFEILNNIVQANITGIELDSNCNKLTTVQFNLIQNNNNPGPGPGNGIQTNFGLCNGTIDRNKFSGHTNSSMLILAGFNLTITNNELVPGTPERIIFANVTTATIKANVSTGSTSSGTIRLFGGNSGVTIEANTLLNGIRGVFVDDPFLVGINTNIAAHQNCIQMNSIAGMQVDPFGYPVTPQLNAENNWWGSPTGPFEFPRNTSGMGDKIIDLDQNVDFDPWLPLPPSPPCPQPPPPNTPGKVTGGGQIPGEDPIFSPLGDLISVPALVPSVAGPTSKATFGFNAKCCAPSGNLEYNDHEAGVRIKSKSIDGLFISSPGTACAAIPGSKHARFTGMAAVIRSTGSTNERFAVDVDDCGEPGTSDTFGIKAESYSNGPSTLIGGNIQIH